MADEPVAQQDSEKLREVADAGARAAAAADTPEQATADAKTAMKAERDKQELKMSDEDIEKIADMFVGKTISAFEQRGAFEPPPEPVHAAPPETAPPPPGEQHQPAPETPAETAPKAPERRTAAHRFFGIGG